MLRQRTESFKAHFESVPGWTGPLASKTAAWVVAGLLIVGGFVYGIRGSSTESLEPLFGGHVLRDIELAQIELAFSSEGLTEYQRDENRILIPRQQRHQYLGALKQASALPYALRMETAGAENGVGFFQSEAERKRSRDDDKAHQLGSKIMTTFGNIAWSSVVYDTRTVGGFDPTVIQSASVVLIPADGQPISPAEVRAIRDFVCGAYAGMEPDHVTVIDASSRKTFRGDEDPLQRQRRQTEYEMEQRLADLLSGYKGLRIAVTSEVVHDQTGNREADNTAKPANAKLLPVGGADLSMRISVGVPESQFHRQWVGQYHARYPGSSLVQRPTPDQIEAIKEKVFQNIRDAVSPFIVSGGTTPPQAVQVWSFPDANKTYRYADDPTAPSAIDVLLSKARRHVWLVAPAGILLAVALVFGISALLMRMQTAPPELAATQAADSPPAARRSGTAAETDPPDESKLKDELAEMIEQNPELAAQIVHSWMVDAA